MRKLLGGILCLLSACQYAPNGPPPPGAPHGFDETAKPDPAIVALIKERDADVPSLVKGNTGFGLALYHRLAKEDGNLFFSPYSISNALAMTYAGARGATASEMKATLRFQLDDEKLHPTFGNLIGQLDGDGTPRTFQLSIANRLWGQKDYGFVPEFLKNGRDFYRAGLEEVDFKQDPEAERRRINGWVEKKTKDKIKDLIPPDLLKRTTRLVLTNAIFFKATWVTPFNGGQTKPGTFHLRDGKTVKTPLMHHNLELSYADLGSFSLVEMPYDGGEQSMIVLLPKKTDGLNALETKLTEENLALWFKQLTVHQVDLKLPKFKVEAKFNLNELLKKMGMPTAFDPERADFSAMATHGDERLYISAVLHKAFVDVNEKGTEAAAATAVLMSAADSDVPPPPGATFHADRPFVFLIRDQRSGSILFVGRVLNPAS